MWILDSDEQTQLKVNGSMTCPNKYLQGSDEPFDFRYFKYYFATVLKVGLQPLLLHARFYLNYSPWMGVFPHKLSFCILSDV